MLKKLEIQDAIELHSYLIDPLVYPFVRYKAETLDEYLFVTKQVLEKETMGELITRVIVNEQGKVIGQISLYDIWDNKGFLGTWFGTPFHGKGYNRLAKENFFSELFYGLGMETVYIKIRKTNEKSRKATLKLPYVNEITHTNLAMYNIVNKENDIFDLFEIRKEIYEQHMPNRMEA